MTCSRLQMFTIVLAASVSFAVITVPGSDTALAATPASISTTVMPAKAVASVTRWTAMRWAKTQAGKPYVYGADGPGSYDCSGLVMAAYHHAGKYLPHNTQAMIASGRLVRVSRSSVRWGDLAFFGTGHVELWGHWTNKAKTRGITFGAHHSGTVLSYRLFGPGWSPTAFYHVK